MPNEHPKQASSAGEVPENPPAFPESIAVDPSGDVYGGATGMTLRDWFAGQALAHASELSYAEYYGKNGNRDARRFLAEHCYDIADAMLRARTATGADQ